VTSAREIYVALVDEGTKTWRPAQARAVAANEFEILGVVPEGEVWEFPPGTRVRCKEQQFASGETALVAFARAAPQHSLERTVRDKVPCARAHRVSSLNHTPRELMTRRPAAQRGR